MMTTRSDSADGRANALPEVRTRKLDVMLGTAAYPVGRFAMQLFAHLGRRARHQRIRRDVHMARYNAERGNDRALTNFALVQQNGVHADQRTPANQTALEDRTVTDRDFVLDDGRSPRAHVQHTIVLDAGARADPNAVIGMVAAQDRTKPDTGFFTDLDFADQHGGRCQEGGRMVSR